MQGLCQGYFMGIIIKFGITCILFLLYYLRGQGETDVLILKHITLNNAKFILFFGKYIIYYWLLNKLHYKDRCTRLVNLPFCHMRNNMFCQLIILLLMTLNTHTDPKAQKVKARREDSGPPSSSPPEETIPSQQERRTYRRHPREPGWKAEGLGEAAARVTDGTVLELQCWEHLLPVWDIN